LLGLSLGPEVPPEARAYTLEASDGVLTGELVVTDAAHNRFRLVGHGGSFIAPAGTPVEAFDGKPVRVEISHDGRVLQISQMPIQVEPITHGFGVVTGQLAVADAVMRTFTIAGDDRVYVAPSAVDVRPYAGRIVEVRLDERGNVMDVTLASRFGGAPVTSSCSYNGQGYSDGASACQSGTQYRCEGGTWRSLGLACAALSAQPCDVDGMRYLDGETRCERGAQFLCEHGQWRNLTAVCASDGATVYRSPRTCMLGGSSVASGSSMCRAGTTFRCADGEWVDVGAPCS
jgi:hypothetical protein